MTLLEDVVTGASGTAAVSTLLRQLKVIAARTGTVPLSEWVARELDGYPGADSLPDYRGPFEVPALGHFVGPFNSEVRNVQIPPSTFPEDMRETTLFKLWLLQPVAELERLSKEESVQFGWPADAVRMYNIFLANGRVTPTVREDMALAGVMRPVAAHVFVGALDAVRTQILDLALEIEQVAPSAGQPEAPRDVQGRAAEVINNYNFHGTSNVAIGSGHVTQIVSPPSKDDREGVLRYLGAAGVEPSRLAELQQALETDVARADTGWTRARAWFSAAAADVGTGALGSAIAAAATAFLG